MKAGERMTFHSDESSHAGGRGFHVQQSLPRRSEIVRFQDSFLYIIPQKLSRISPAFS